MVIISASLIGKKNGLVAEEQRKTAEAQTATKKQAYETRLEEISQNLTQEQKNMITALDTCSSCGLPSQDGTNGTCVQFMREKDCPKCGIHVQPMTCHTCAN